jgi:hypothetical protein
MLQIYIKGIIQTEFPAIFCKIFLNIKKNAYLCRHKIEV